MLKGKILIILKVLRISGIIFIVLVIMILSYNVMNNNKIQITLDSCVDGDTAWFIVDGKREKVRFLGIDTPESTNAIEEYGKEASNFTCDKLKLANEIYIEYDSNSDKYDKYGRLLGYLFIDNYNLNELILLNGFAEVKYIYGDYKYIENFCIAQDNAYRNKLNIWNIYDYTNNYCNNIK